LINNKIGNKDKNNNFENIKLNLDYSEEESLMANLNK
jgi:hypothetical protein